MAKKTKLEKKAEKIDQAEKNKENGGNGEEEESFLSKVGMFFVTLLIIAIWLAIIAVLIKADVGGFASTSLYPVLKDVPVVNKILPDVSLEDTEYVSPYTTVAEAEERITELESQLAEAQTSIETDQQTIADLNAQVDDLSTYKTEQDEFETEKEKFYEEVVFSDNAPDITEYKTYYESIDPDNAAALYKQVVEQTEYDDDIDDYVKTYSSMKPKDAAAIFDTMTDNLALVTEILENMDAQSRGDILSNMDTDTAAKVTAMLEPKLSE